MHEAMMHEALRPHARPDRALELEGLRGVCATLVVLSHWGEFLPQREGMVAYVAEIPRPFGFLAVMRTVNSPFGEILKAIRENEPRAVSLGYRAPRYKLAAFVLSAAIAGLAGATKAIVAQNASLTDVSFAASGEVVLMTLVGGMGTFYGPVVGALIVVSMQNYLAQFGEWVTVIQGVVFVACVLAFRRGIVGELAARAKISL